jgi:hypothetical protein
MRIRGLFVLSALAVLSAGCSSIEPWVKPYDRENLADLEWRATANYFIRCPFCIEGPNKRLA